MSARNIKHEVSITPWVPFVGSEVEPIAKATGYVDLTDRDTRGWPSGGPALTINVFPISGGVDAESDPAHLGRIEVVQSSVYLGHWPRTIYVVGFVKAFSLVERKVKSPDNNNNEWAYLPPKFKGWKPGLASIKITQVGP